MTDKRESPDGLSGVLKMGRRLFGGKKAARGGPERRSGKRVALPVQVRVSVGDGSLRPARVGEVNLPGFSFSPSEDARIGAPVRVEFDGFPDISPPFAVQGQVVRVLDDSDEVAIAVDRQATPPPALKNYRTLVRHYLHHKPLLEDLNKGYFEGRCDSCQWVGRVGRRAPRCSQCGSTKIVPIN
jgi:hypothetical protein